MKRTTTKQKQLTDKKYGILALYKTGKFTTEEIAKNYGISPRQVQRVAKAGGVIRTQAEANRLMAPLKKYRTIPIELRVKRKQLSLKQRYSIISAQPWCTTCGMKPTDGIRLEVDHVDENPENNSPDNLQVLCGKCNVGKSYSIRYPIKEV